MRLNAVAIDKRAVGAVQVAHLVTALDHANVGVLARHLRVGQIQRIAFPSQRNHGRSQIETIQRLNCGRLGGLRQILVGERDEIAGQRIADTDDIAIAEGMRRHPNTIEQQAVGTIEVNNLMALAVWLDARVMRRHKL